MSRRFQGLNAWILQRVSAVYLALYFTYLVYHFSFSPPVNHQALKLWIASPWVYQGIGLFFLLLLGHIWVGLRDVIMDYVPSLVLRASVMIVLALALSACALWIIRILLKTILI